MYLYIILFRIAYVCMYVPCNYYKLLYKIQQALDIINKNYISDWLASTYLNSQIGFMQWWSERVLQYSSIITFFFLTECYLNVRVSFLNPSAFEHNLCLSRA